MTTLPNPARLTTSTRPAAEVFAALAANVGLALRGKPEVVELALMCLMAEGHLLIEDVPGVGKTSLVKAMARSIDCDFGRIQFTPDLLPTDVVGVSVWNRKDHTFEFRPGPVFASVVLADEINRASPKTQSALLEAMAESQVTVDGTTYRLPNPFMVVATQNPVEHEGTYPLPESQMDRFLIRTAVGYPSPAAEMDILDGHTGSDPVALLDPVVSAAEVRVMVAETRSVHAAPALRSYLTALATATRQHPQLTLGMSPRATLALLQASRAKALVAGRNFVTPDDVHAMAAPVLDHRLICTPAAQMSGVTGSDIVTDVLSSVPVPGGNP
jgi:MoxR-like ATPase